VITLRVSSQSGSVAGTEIAAGEWIVSSEEFADFMDLTAIPPSLTILGGTIGFTADWQSAETYVRAETFSWVANRFLDEREGLNGSRDVVMSGVTYPPADDLPAETVF